MEALKSDMWVVVFQETTSSASKEKTQFDAALATLEDVVDIVFTKLDLSSDYSPSSNIFLFFFLQHLIIFPTTFPKTTFSKKSIKSPLLS